MGIAIGGRTYTQARITTKKKHAFRTTHDTANNGNREQDAVFFCNGLPQLRLLRVMLSRLAYCCPELDAAAKSL